MVSGSLMSVRRATAGVGQRAQGLLRQIPSPNSPSSTISAARELRQK